jgi:glutaredoxin-like protein NrdH
MTFVVYTKSNCQPCNATKRRFAAAGVETIEVKIDDGSPSSDAIVTELKADGFQESPVVKVIDEHGDYVNAWSGYRPDLIDEHVRAA